MLGIIYEKNTAGEIFKKLADGSYEKVLSNSSELDAWLLINKEIPLNTELDPTVG